MSVIYNSGRFSSNFYLPRIAFTAGVRGNYIRKEYIIHNAQEKIPVFYFMRVLYDVSKANHLISDKYTGEKRGIFGKTCTVHQRKEKVFLSTCIFRDCDIMTIIALLRYFYL